MLYTVYYKKSCPYSRKAIDLLYNVLRANPEAELKLIDASAIDLKDVLEKANVFHHRTVPAIFEDDHFIGGYDQLSTSLQWQILDF